MVRISKRTIVDGLRDKWTKCGAWRKLFLLLAILFFLFWISLASLVALPAITSVHFLTMIIKNVMDIHANWKWGSLLPSKKDKSGEIIGEVDYSEDTFVKFPPEDPRTPKSTKQSKKEIKHSKAQPLPPEKKKAETRGATAPKKAPVQGGQKIGVAGAPVKKPEIHISKQQKMVDTTTQDGHANN